METLDDVKLVKLPADAVGAVMVAWEMAVPAMVGATGKFTADPAVAPYTVPTLALSAFTLARYCVPTFGGVVAILYYVCMLCWMVCYLKEVGFLFFFSTFI